MKNALIASVSALAAAATIMSAPAVATGTAYKVQVGSLPASVTEKQITLQSNGAVSFSAGPVSCTGSGVPATATPVSTVKNSPATTIVDLATVNRLQFTGCRLTARNIAMTATVQSPIALHAVSGATNAATDTLAAHLDSVSIYFSAANPSICSLRVNGTMVGSYRESTQQLNLAPVGSTGSLITSNVTGCFGDIANGQSVSFTGSYALAVDGGYNINVKP